MDCPLEILLPGDFGLVRQCEHEVEIDVVEAGSSCGGYCAFDVVRRMNSTDPDQFFFLEALGADTDSVETRASHRCELLGINRAWVRFAGDFAVGDRRMRCCYCFEEAREIVFGKESWRSTAEEDGFGRSSAMG